MRLGAMSLQLLHNASSPHAVPAVRQIAHSIVEASQDDWSNAGTLAYVHCPLHVQCLGCDALSGLFFWLRVRKSPVGHINRHPYPAILPSAGLQPLAPLEQEASPEGDAGEGEQSQQPLLTGQESSSFTAAQDHAAADHVDGFVPPLDAASMPEINPSNHQHQHSRPAADRHQQNIEQDGSEGSENYLPDAIKLGLGDFIFYSVLVGRAAMYDMLTALVSYLAVMAGLGTTLLLLAVFRKALPALPISIGLGVMFYLLARLLLEPFVLNLSTQLIFV